MGSVVRQAGIIQAGLLRVQQAGCGAALGLAAVVGAAPALAQPGDPARDALFRQTFERPGDLAATLRFAKAARDANDPEAAVGALERAVFFAPGSSRAQYELAMLYARMGSNAQAVVHFKNALQAGDLEPSVRIRAETFMAEAEKQLSPSRIFGYVQTGIRYQSNGGYVPDGGTIRVFGADLPVSSVSSRRSDGNAFLLAQIGQDYDFGNDRGDRFESRFTGYLTRQFNLPQANLAFGEVNLGPRFFISSDGYQGASVRPYAVGGTTFVGGSQYVSSGGGGVSVRMPLTSNLVIDTGLEGRALYVNEPPLLPSGSLGSGSIISGSAALGWRPSDYLSFEPRAFVSRAYGRLPWQTFSQQGIEATIRYEFDPPLDTFPRRWSFVPYAKLIFTQFDAPNPFVDAFNVRKDTEWRAGFALDMPLTGTFGLSGLVQWANVSSAIPNYRNRNFSVLFGPTARF